MVICINATINSSEEWTLISEEEREEMGLSFDFDGEFWLLFWPPLVYTSNR